MKLQSIFEFVLFCICLLHEFAETVRYDDDCFLDNEPTYTGFLISEVALIIDQSKGMEKYRMVLQKNFSNIFSEAGLKYTKLTGNRYTSYMGIQLVSVTNGCSTIYAYDAFFPNFRRPDRENLRKIITQVNKIGSKENAKSGIENVLDGVYNAAEKLWWNYPADCELTKPGCLYYTQNYFLFTGSTSSPEVKNCNNNKIQSMENIKKKIHEKVNGFKRLPRIIGFFPKQQLVEEYAKIAKELDVPYCGRSFDGDEKKILELPDFLIECFQDEANRAIVVTQRQCQWEDPIGYNTLGL